MREDYQVHPEFLKKAEIGLDNDVLGEMLQRGNTTMECCFKGFEMTIKVGTSGPGKRRENKTLE